MILFNILKYRNWEKQIFNERKFLCLEDVEIDQEEIESKIEDFVLSDSQTEFIVFEVHEVLHILQSNMQKGENIVLKDLCILSSRGLWTILLQYEIRAVSMPWLVLDIVKDERETAEVYVKELTIGDIAPPFGLSRNIMRDINRGISEGIILLNENQFLGRGIRNIELLEERVVIR